MRLMMPLMQKHWLRAREKRRLHLRRTSNLPRRKLQDAVSHLAEARERAAAAQAKALELEGKLADRSLTDAQLSTISRKLVRFAGTRI